MLNWYKVFSLLLICCICTLVTKAQPDSLDLEESPPFEMVWDSLPPPPPQWQPSEWPNDSTNTSTWASPANKMTSFCGIDFGFISLRGNYGNAFSKSHPLSSKSFSSYALRVNLFHKKINIIQNYFGIATGLGYAHEQLSFRNATAFNSSVPGFSIVDTIEYKTNQLRRNGIFAPILLEFNTKNNNSENNNMRVALGLAFSYYFSQQGLTRYMINSNSHLESRITKIYGAQNFYGEFHIKFYYRNFGFFVTAPLNSIFSQVNAFPITFGINANSKLF